MDKKTLAIVNGAQINDEKIESFFLYDRGFAYADGLFETIRWQNGIIPLERYHVERLMDGCRHLGIPVDPNTVHSNLALAKELASLNRFEFARIKLVVTRGSDGVGCYTQENKSDEYASKPNLFILVHEHKWQASSASYPVSLKTSIHPIIEHPQLAGIKHLNRLNYIIAAKDQVLLPGQELLFLSEQGHIVETMHHNIFWIKNNIVYTPKLTDAGVNGVLKQLIKNEVLPKLNIDLEEVDAPLASVYDADEVFISNAFQGVQLVSSVDHIDFVTDSAVHTKKIKECVESRFSNEG